MALEGFLDFCTSDSVTGWAWNPETPATRIAVDVFDGNRQLKRIVANEFRSDLELAGKGDGHCAFGYRIPAGMLDNTLHQVHVRFADTGGELMNSPRKAFWRPSDRYSPELERSLRSMLNRSPWDIVGTKYSGDVLEISGWALPPGDNRLTTFTLNGRLFEQVNNSLPSSGLEKVFWYWPGSDQCGFTCRTAIAEAEVFRQGSARFEYVDASSLTALYSFHNFYWPPNLWSVENLPSGSDIRRVAGHSQRHAFLQGGYTTFTKLRQVLEQIAGQWPKGATLDWGCGCARITRWLIDQQLPGVEIFGADIDTVNISWCEGHLSHGHFSTIPLHPPTHYADGQFNVILGMSVFTHLQKDVQFEWLDELRRIAAPGAILLLSVHSDASVCQVVPSESWLCQWKSEGFDASQLDTALVEVVNDKEYYRAAFHTTSYIHTHWSRYFEIVEIVDAFMSNHQDLLVLRRR